jgi:predicted Zn-ribbon and HTH transcriptional regulator
METRCSDCGFKIHPDEMGDDGICLSCKKILVTTWRRLDEDYYKWS